MFFVVSRLVRKTAEAEIPPDVGLHLDRLPTQSCPQELVAAYENLLALFKLEQQLYEFQLPLSHLHFVQLDAVEVQMHLVEQSSE